MNQQPAVVVILGPTAVGKTDLSIKLASRLKGEIVSMDSRLIYRGMDIGTAKPSLDQRRQIVHHMIDIADPDEEWGLAKYCQFALDAIASIHEQNLLPLLVGGTGQYITAILQGWAPPPKPTDATLRDELTRFAQTHGNAALHKKLDEIDPRLRNGSMKITFAGLSEPLRSTTSRVPHQVNKGRRKRLHSAVFRSGCLFQGRCFTLELMPGSTR